ncbi:MBL fold metallo-hydrolase [Chloroflexota bacterium]
MKIINNLHFYPQNGIEDCNTYVIKGEISVIIDPGLPQYFPVLLKKLSEDGIDPSDIGIIANTHLHGDHCWTDAAFRQLSGARVTFHSLQKKYYPVTYIETTRFFGLEAEDFQEDGCFEDSHLNTGNMGFELIHSPGHSPDSICYYCLEDKVLICGDVIFDRNIGRVDLPGGNAGELTHSIEQLSKLGIEYLFPGHMDIVTGTERVKNNFEYMRKNILGWL